MFDPKTNLHIGEYDLIEELGRGGQSTVYKARHRLMNREVALKVLNESHLQDERMRRAFRIEIEVSAMLSHPHILRAYDAREFEGVPYLIMELCSGKDLGHELRTSKTLPLTEAVNYIRQAALGLSFAHEHSVVHRDVKPSNLFLTAEKAVLVFDWGLASLRAIDPRSPESPEIDPAPSLARVEDLRSDESSFLQTIWRAASGAASQTQIRSLVGRRVSRLSWTGHVIGTPAFMAPEQALSSAVDLRADIYSLGATLYGFLVGCPMFDGNVYEVIRAAISHEAPSIRSTRSDVSKELESVYRKMVAKDPGDRYQSMSEVISALDRLGMPSRIFISYRREDTLDATDRMYELLREHFGTDNVFMDVDTIPPGADFREHLKLAIAQAGIVLVVIGDYWVASGSRKKRRLNDPNDFVRIEIEAALAMKIPVIPVLVGQARMPAPQELPDSLRTLAFQQAAELRPGRHYHDQMEALIVAIKKQFDASK